MRIGRNLLAPGINNRSLFFNKQISIKKPFHSLDIKVSRIRFEKKEDDDWYLFDNKIPIPGSRLPESIKRDINPYEYDLKQEEKGEKEASKDNKWYIIDGIAYDSSLFSDDFKKWYDESK